MKTEPETFSWADLVRDGHAMWDGVRNFQARNNMKAMKVGDLALIYHSVSDKEVAGVAEIVGEHRPDPTTRDNRWVVVDLKPVAPLQQPVGLATVKADPALADMILARNSRLSVQPVTAAEFRRILALGKTKL
jgi:predicted RNA-binding protein with PUA-like domain